MKSHSCVLLESPNRNFSWKSATLWTALIFIFLFSFIIFNCSESPTFFKDLDISLTVKPEATEAWIELHIGGLKTAARYVVKRDTVILYDGALNSPDTVLNDKNLEPLTTYTYSAYARKSGDQSATVKQTISTLDTTSHKIEWEKIIIESPGGTAVLRDVDIISENEIWAVGQIYPENVGGMDSLGNRIDPYNAAYWDGNKWELLRIPFLNSVCSAVKYPSIRAIKSVNIDSIWFARSSSIVKYFNEDIYFNDCRPQSMLNGGINKMFNISNAMYLAGGRGTLLYYIKNNWFKIESGIELDINDIWGTENPLNSDQEIYAVAARQYENTEKAILSVKDKQVHLLPDIGVRSSLSSVWFKNGLRYYVVGAGIYTKHDIKSTQPWQEIKNRSSDYYLEAIRGNDVNDIFVCGHFGELMHYNGSYWKSYQNQINLESGILRAVDVKGDLVVAVGMDGWNAVIIKGKRQ